jgi:hydroxyacylglutathione hydrolase
LYFRRFYDEGLAQASYLIGCERTGEAIVVDANRDAAPYVAAATADGLRITQITETHIHADFVSGSRELARLTGGAVALSAEGGPDWQYGWGRSDRARLIREGDSISVGDVRLDVLHTPGHTPEHLVFLVTDRAASDAPLGLLSGDFVFVGDVGRPDLLETAAGISGTMEAAARSLFQSLARFRTLPDFVQLWPGHGAGSLCGKALSATPQSTVGYEKVANWALAVRDQETFVRAVLDGQPDPPPYFAAMKRINRDGPAMMRVPSQARELDWSAVADHERAGELVVDVRAAPLFATAHLPGSLSLPLGKSFLGWAGWLMPYDHDIVVLASSAADARQAMRDLSFIGIDRVTGWCTDGVFADWTRSGRPLGTVAQISVAEAAIDAGRSAVTFVDVRDRAEWEDGHIDGALQIPLGNLRARLGEISRLRPIVVHCQSGTRSAIAASILLAGGRIDVSNLRGGFSEWLREGHHAARD